MVSNDQKAILDQKLANLLGMDDGADYLLDHLLTIDDLDDIKEYLSQLLGSLTVDCMDFLGDLDKFRRGEKLEAIVIEQKPAPDPVPAEKPKAATSSVPTQRTKETKPVKSQPYVKKQSQPMQEKQVKKPNETTSTKPSLKKPPPTSNQQNLKKPQTMKPVKQKKPQKNPRSLEKGKAKLECGCFGTKHRPLTNCIHCGRISCEREGYDYCNFCGYMVEPPSPPDENDPTYEAWVLKEKVLMHQKEKSKRTVVYDAQSDHYGNERNEWLTKKEQEDTVAQQEARNEELHHRRKVKLNFL